MGLLVYVARTTLGDCTLYGISRNHDKLCVVNVDGPFEPSMAHPAVILESHVKGCLRIVPAVKNGIGEWEHDTRWFMAGGNYAETSDSRFSDKCEQLTGQRFYGAVAIHDRYEG
jgi:hypothetical protein